MALTPFVSDDLITSWSFHSPTPPPWGDRSLLTLYAFHKVREHVLSTSLSPDFLPPSTTFLSSSFIPLIYSTLPSLLSLPWWVFKAKDNQMRTLAFLAFLVPHAFTAPPNPSLHGAKGIISYMPSIWNLSSLPHLVFRTTQWKRHCLHINDEKTESHTGKRPCPNITSFTWQN